MVVGIIVALVLDDVADWMKNRGGHENTDQNKP